MLEHRSWFTNGKDQKLKVSLPMTDDRRPTIEIRPHDLGLRNNFIRGKIPLVGDIPQRCMLTERWCVP